KHYHNIRKQQNGLKSGGFNSVVSRDTSARVDGRIAMRCRRYSNHSKYHIFIRRIYHMDVNHFLQQDVHNAQNETICILDCLIRLQESYKANDYKSARIAAEDVAKSFKQL